MSAPRTRSKPPECSSKICLIWAELPHSSFLATSPAYKRSNQRHQLIQIQMYLLEFVSYQCNYDSQKMYGALYFCSGSENERWYKELSYNKTKIELTRCSSIEMNCHVLALRTSSLWSVNTTSQQNLLQRIPVTPVFQMETITLWHQELKLYTKEIYWITKCL